MRRVSISRLIALSSTSRILGIGGFRIQLQVKAGGFRDQRRRNEGICLSPSGDQRQADREATALVDLAFDNDLAAHQFAEPLAERQAQSGATVFAGAGVVGNGELLEQVGDLIRGDTNTGVDDVDYETIAEFPHLTLGADLTLAL